MRMRGVCVALYALALASPNPVVASEVVNRRIAAARIGTRVETTPQGRMDRPIPPKPLVILDPGHGGTNLGASAASGTLHEKRLTLVLARLTAEELLRQEPRLRVLLTRYEDRFVSLQARVDRANLERGEVFVSLHLNACESHAQRGFEVYVLNAEASEREGARQAQHASMRLSPAWPDAPVAAIVADLRQHAQHEQSVRLALSVHQALGLQRPAAENRGLREGSFDVLMGLHMPGVLVELGFIDHPLESQELQKPEIQRQLAQSMARGILTFLRLNQS